MIQPFTITYESFRTTKSGWWDSSDHIPLYTLVENERRIEFPQGATLDDLLDLATKRQKAAFVIQKYWKNWRNYESS